MVPKVLKQEVKMAKFTLKAANIQDKIYKDGFALSGSKNISPRLKLGTQEGANKINQGGVQIIPLSRKRKRQVE